VQYSEAEIRFLMRPHRIETSTGRSWEMHEVVDLRTINCPESIFERVLQDRARRLNAQGGKFTEFRNAHRPTAPVPAPPARQTTVTPTPSSLDADLAAAKLF
jgi:hypothetical protein